MSVGAIKQHRMTYYQSGKGENRSANHPRIRQFNVRNSKFSSRGGRGVACAGRGAGKDRPSADARIHRLFTASCLCSANSSIKKNITAAFTKMEKGISLYEYILPYSWYFIALKNDGSWQTLQKDVMYAWIPKCTRVSVRLSPSDILKSFS